eukprot:gene3850-4112_t
MLKVETEIPSTTLEKVWDCWTKPEHIVNWNFASETWCCPSAKNDLRVRGDFSYRMEAKDGSFGFDYCGSYDEIIEHRLIRFALGDGRKVCITFENKDDGVYVVEEFEPELENSLDLQKSGWQAILDNFRKHVESC